MSSSEQQNSSNGIKWLYPVLFAVMLIIGIGIGTMINQKSSGKVSVFNRAQYDRLEEILNYINVRYVDTVNTEKLFHTAVSEMFKQLDPHSLYISSEELARLNEPLRGGFEGIGVEFFIVEDTITVVSALDGGPAAAVGIRAGDKIVAIEDTNVAGVGITNEDVIHQLKGPAGTKVKVSVMREEQGALIDFEITRGEVSLSSIDAAYMIRPKTGYIKLSKFAATTHEEMVNAIEELKARGMQQLILDLRGNGGGYLDQATKVADEFLSGNKKIVYTEGRMYPEKVYRAGNPGVYEEGKLVVMINEGSASASEILAGALQDWGRATIVGRRSFGKALVQEEILLSDGSAMRLTVARYYTPKGRSIQRSYEDGVEEYAEDHWARMQSEYTSPDSFATHDSARYGISPDVYISWDTSDIYRVTISIINRGYIPIFAYDYFSNHQSYFNQIGQLSEFLSQYTVPERVFESFVAYMKAQSEAAYKDIFSARDSLQLYNNAIKTALKAYFGRQLFYQKGFYPVMNKMDHELDKAIEIARRNEQLTQVGYSQ